MARLVWSLSACVVCLSLTTLAAAQSPPAVGDSVPDFSLKDLGGKNVKLSEQYAKGPVVLVVLRGYPGYQCPFCSQQVGNLLKSAKEFERSGAQVVMVYPGPANGLDARAREFAMDKQFPANFSLLVDPDLKVTDAYHLRWNAPNETAYPSSFVIDRGGKVLYAKVSKVHGDRAATKDLLGALPKTGS